MTKKLTEKYNDSCVKLFEFLKRLHEKDVEFKWVLDLISDGKYDGKSNTHVALNKYLNALRIFGIKIKKINKKYHLLNSPYTLDFNLDDIKSIQIIKEAIAVLPEGKIKVNCETFVHKLEVRYNKSAQNTISTLNTKNKNHLLISQKNLIEQIRQCEKYCQEKQKLEIIYTNTKGEEINLLCSPIEQTCQKQKVVLKVLGNNGSRIYEIPIERIKHIKQLPSAVSNQSIPTTIVYRIKNRLARNYKLREWERLDKIEADGSRIIINKNEDLDMLLKRLMRYGTECEICSPKFFKEEMIKLINETISNYE